MNLLKKIWHLQPSVKTFHQDRYQYVSGSNWNLHKKKLEQIKAENKLIGQKFIHQQHDTQDYKKKLKEEIKEYVELRDNIRKVKVSPNKNRHSKSEKKIVAGFKLEKMEKAGEEGKEEKEAVKEVVKENPEGLK